MVLIVLYNITGKKQNTIKIVSTMMIKLYNERFTSELRRHNYSNHPLSGDTLSSVDGANCRLPGRCDRQTPSR